MSEIPGVLVSGNAVFDILVRPVGEIQWHETTWVESIEQRTGGNGANTSYALGKLGVPVRLISRVGQDGTGDVCLARLTSADVDVRWVERRPGVTAATVVLVHASGARKFLHRPGVSAEEFDGPVSFTAELVSGAARYHFGNPFALPGMRRWAAESLRRAKEAGLATSLDTGWDAKGEWLELIGPCLPFVDLLFANEDEAKMLAACGEPRDAAHRLRSMGAVEVILKRGAGGCTVFTETEEIQSPAFPARAVDTTGAGDCFAGAYLAALVRGMDRPEAARLANAVGALSIQKLGATEGVLPWDETLAWMDAHGRRLR